mgnify:CR=1 FL=1
MKKGVFFTIDALLASGIIIISIVLISKFYYSEQQTTNVNYASKDIVNVFSAMTVNGVNNEYVKNLIASGLITDTSNTLIEQIGDFWANDNIDIAKNFTKNLTEDIIPKNYGFSVLVDGEEIYSRNIPVTKSLVSTRKIISGIAKAKPTKGYTARVLLSGIKSKKTGAYAYFGGYEGDGNLTKKLILPNDILSFNSSYIEVDGGGNFNLYINNVFSGSYTKGSSGGGNMLADKWNLSNAYLSNFRAGENTININFTSGNNYIAGGFLKVTYTTSSYNDTQVPGYDKYLFPGIDGTINLYSSIYIPNTLNSMKIFLNYSSDYTAYLNIGNTTVYQGTTNGTTKNFTVSNSTLAGLLDYSSIVQKTLPLRLGLTDISFLKKGNADVVLITDVSGSMDWRLDSSSTGTSRNCNDPLLFNPSTKRISLAKCLDNQFVDIILNSSQGNTTNRVGLVSYSGLPNTIPTAASTIIVSIKNLTNSNVTLKNEISTYTPNGATGICGSIRQARIMLQNLSNSSRQKFVVVMTDGLANVQCSPTNEYSTSGCIAKTCNDNSFCAGGGCLKQQCGDWISDRAANDSINDACRAYNTTNATVFSIGFGPVSTCSSANQTLMSIANCGKGSYYSSGNASQLSNIYSTVAQQILNATFSDQTINTSGSLRTKLFPNSFIEFNYTIPDVQFNKLPLGFETNRFGNNISNGYLYIYPNTSVSGAKVTSYSGSKWTDNLVVNGNTIYQLSTYGTNYLSLGDPFTVNIPEGNLINGNNSITISTGTNSSYSTNGSSDDKVIYTLLLNGFTDYSSVGSKSDGCSWTLSFEDGTSSTVKVPADYIGADICSFSAKIYDSNDALDNAVFQLFNNLDMDKNGKLEVNIDENSLNINTLTVSKVPSLWGPAIIEIRVWE